MEGQENTEPQQPVQSPAQPEPVTTSGNPSHSSSRRNKKKGKSFIFVLIIIIIVAALAGGAWHLLREPDIESETTTTSGLTPPEARTPTSTPVPTVVEVEMDREEVSIQILNGTGIPGEAGFLQGELEALGFVTIEVANADETDNTVTVVTFLKDLPSSITDEITEELEDIYNSVDTKTSSSTGEYDVIIVTGLRPGKELPSDEEEVEEEEPTETPTPTPTETVTPTPEA